MYRALGLTVDGSPFREASLASGELNLDYAWWGTLVALLLGGVLARVVPGGVARTSVRRVAAVLARPSGTTFALAAAVLAAGLAWAAWALLFQGHYTNVDEIASMLHARYLAAGRLAGDVHGHPAAWLFPNTLMVEEGWVSQYPPSHLALMALFVRLGAPGLLGPALVGASAFLLALSLPRLLPEHRIEGRAATLLFSLSPFAILLAGGALSHLSAAAFLLLALYGSLRARDGASGWAVLAGVGVGLAVTSRPLQGLVLGTLFTLGPWVPRMSGRQGRWLVRRCAATVLGGLPFAVMLGWFNDRLFGDPFTLGYSAAYGERHGLGFHVDPWGYPYGLAEAVGFTSTDLLEVGIRFLETPIPLTAVVGLYLLTARALPRGAGFLVAWATLPVVANAAYWFHASRMIYEAGPAWLALAVLGLAHFARAPEAAGKGPARGWRRWRSGLTLWTSAVALAMAVGWGVPQRIETQRWSDETLRRITPPALDPEAGGALVFVHTGWNERMSAILQGEGGMRSDTLTSVLRRNASCRVQAYAEARAAGARTLPELDLLQEPGMAPGVELTAVQGIEATIRHREGAPFTAECMRQLRADRLGTVSLAPLLLKGELPGLETGDGILFARDLGPRRNRALMALYPERAPYLLVPPEVGAAPRALPYAAAERRLWGGAPAAGGEGRGAEPTG